LLLAENDYFALGLMEFGDPEELSASERESAAELAERVSPDAGAKRWDAYLVLLSPTTLGGDAMPESVTEIIYNTNFFRRIVRWNVQPDEASLSRALRSFLPFVTAQEESRSNPLTRLAQTLPSYGVSEADGLQEIARWRASGSRNG
jgi:hypothetical protein